MPTYDVIGHVRVPFTATGVEAATQDEAVALVMSKTRADILALVTDPDVPGSETYVADVNETGP